MWLMLSVRVNPWTPGLCDLTEPPVSVFTGLWALIVRITSLLIILASLSLF